MLTIYGTNEGVLERRDGPPEAMRRADAIWIDLLNPTPEEERAVETFLGLQVPTREEMSEIEESSRLYREADALMLTATVIEGAGSERPKRAPVSFVLTGEHLVTVRYADPEPFRIFAARCQRRNGFAETSATLFGGLIETVVGRAADILELVAADLSAVSDRLFFEEPERPRKQSRHDAALQSLIRKLGRKNTTVSILRESLVGLGRIVSFLRASPTPWLQPISGQLKMLERDLRSLSDYEKQLSAEVTYLHEATIGLINLDQNRIIQVFSIAAVLFLPPTVVGTIYGMNFDHMPELHWLYGYPMALGLMVVSALVPFVWLKSRGWL